MKTNIIAFVLVVLVVSLILPSAVAGKKLKPASHKKALTHQTALTSREVSPKAATVLVTKITAKQFEFSPKQIVLKKGEPAELDLTSLDVHHGFNCPDLKLRADIRPGAITVLKVRPEKAGTFPFFCDVYCGLGHGDMNGTIVVNE